MTAHRRIEEGDRFSHNTVAVLGAFAASVVGLHHAIDRAERGLDPTDEYWCLTAAQWARSAVRAARLLTVRE